MKNLVFFSLAGVAFGLFKGYGAYHALTRSASVPLGYASGHIAGEAVVWGAVGMVVGSLVAHAMRREDAE